jgi:predicted class III extradiol MEMO1 family dioxygenase
MKYNTTSGLKTVNVKAFMADTTELIEHSTETQTILCIFFREWMPSEIRIIPPIMSRKNMKYFAS